MLKIENLSASYRKTPVLENVSFSLKPHTFTAVLGKNGCGKSTLVSCINQQMRYIGKISYADYNLSCMTPRERAKSIAVLPQILTLPQISVNELVMFGRNPYLDFGKRPSAEDISAVEEAIQMADVAALREKTVAALSGGERQKAYLAMVLAQQTRLLVLDEPTAHMDIENEAAFLELLTTLKKSHKKTLLVIMHDLSSALRFADRIVVLHDRRVAFDGSSEECLNSCILEDVFHVKQHLFTENGTQYPVFTKRT